jgi:hypothetical protein
MDKYDKDYTVIGFSTKTYLIALDKLQDVGNFKQHVNRERHSSLIAA